MFDEINRLAAAPYRRDLHFCWIAAFIVASAGCTNEDQWTRNRPLRVPVSGEVTYQGKPLAEAIVTFTNKAADRSASGTTDSVGRFVLGTFEEADGVVPGAQQVSINKVAIDFPGTHLIGLNREELKVAMSKMTEAELARLPVAQSRWLIPERYGSQEKSELSAEVVESGENHFRFDLHD